MTGQSCVRRSVIGGGGYLERRRESEHEEARDRGGARQKDWATATPQPQGVRQKKRERSEKNLGRMAPLVRTVNRESPLPGHRIASQRQLAAAWRPEREPRSQREKKEIGGLCVCHMPPFSRFRRWALLWRHDPLASCASPPRLFDRFLAFITVE